MRTVFADANYWIGLFNPNDELHPAAIKASRALGRARVVTSEMVLAEVLNGLAKFPALRQRTAEAIDQIMVDPNTEVERQTSLLFREALALYRQHQHKEWSLTDSTKPAIAPASPATAKPAGTKASRPSIRSALLALAQPAWPRANISCSTT
jgi:hypothetical protein